MKVHRYTSHLKSLSASRGNHYTASLPHRGLGTADGRAALVHAVAHIEFNAINLAWDAVYRGAVHLGAEFVLGGSGHNAGVINPPAANKHGFWTNAKQPADAKQWLETATRHEGSWWPWWTKWLTSKGGGKTIAARQPKSPIEPAPGRYAMMP